MLFATHPPTPSHPFGRFPADARGMKCCTWIADSEEESGERSWIPNARGRELELAFRDGETYVVTFIFPDEGTLNV